MVGLLGGEVVLMLVVGEVVVLVEEGLMAVVGSREGRGIRGLVLRMDLGVVEGMLGRREGIDYFY